MNKCKECGKEFKNSFNRKKEFCVEKCRAKFYMRKWHKKNHDSEKKKHALYRTENGDKIRIYRRLWYERNIEKEITKAKEWRIKNVDKVRLAQRLRYKKNRDEILAQRDVVRCKIRRQNRLSYNKNKERYKSTIDYKKRRREAGMLRHYFGTTIVDSDVRKKFSYYQLIKRVLNGKINKEKIPDKIKLIHEGKTYEAYT